MVRAQKGWAPSDTWSLDHYWARVMGESLAHLADSAHSWPGEHSGWASIEDWRREMHEHAAVLKAYSQDWEGQVNPTPSLRRLVEIWGQLWD